MRQQLLPLDDEETRSEHDPPPRAPSRAKRAKMSDRSIVQTLREDGVELPALVRDLIRIIGESATLLIVERWGGMELYVPHPSRMEPSHPIAEAIGIRAAMCLAATYANERVTVPRLAELDRARRNREIYELAYPESGEGLSRRELALRFGLTTRSIRKILASYNPR